ncbi:hypothetical protein TcasGA2_TC002900 [Tribolium castaneum]|uniref:Uncharacterized protein n=1 Tax=Tribolium castaneum TaxID=7070 RepID=D6WHH6_TRICA|nr:hypothetical protein TcasGA2_TC002900 [Tribolium castaneum]
MLGISLIRGHFHRLCGGTFGSQMQEKTTRTACPPDKNNASVVTAKFILTWNLVRVLGAKMWSNAELPELGKSHDTFFDVSRGKHFSFDKIINETQCGFYSNLRKQNTFEEKVSNPKKRFPRRFSATV